MAAIAINEPSQKTPQPTAPGGNEPPKRGRGRPRKYKTPEESRNAQREYNKKYYQNKQHNVYKPTGNPPGRPRVLRPSIEEMHRMFEEHMEQVAHGRFTGYVTPENDD